MREDPLNKMTVDQIQKEAANPTLDELMGNVTTVMSKEMDRMDLGAKQMEGATKQLEEMTNRIVELEKAGDSEGAARVLQAIEDYKIEENEDE